MSFTEQVLETVAKVFGKIFGSANERELKRLWPQVVAVGEAWGPIRTLDDAALRAKTDEFRRRLLAGASEDEILPEAFAVCREAAHRVLGEKQTVPSNMPRLVLENGRFEYRPVEGGEIPYFAHFDVQILGGIVLHQGRIAEMVTGEGKTLVATLPCYLNSLRLDEPWVEKAKELQGEDPTRWTFRPYGLFDGEDGADDWRLLERLIQDPEDVTYVAPKRILPVSRGVHVVTVNDYLAGRDAEFNRPLFEFLGLTVGAIQADMRGRERLPTYMSDIVYGTNNEYGFDYLRDNLKVDPDTQVQRSRFFAIVDEVDSVLIDEARTPLIISGSTAESSDKYMLADRVVRKLQGGDQNEVEQAIEKVMKQGYQREDARIRAEENWDFVYSERDHTAKLTERGMHKVVRILGTDDIYSGANLDMPHFIDNALKAHALYKRDHHYLCKDGQVIIVDEFTGRTMEGRRWSDGLHQAVEAKEGMKIKEESQTIASITFQNFFRLYDRLAGMTGTAMTEAKEFASIYKLGCVSIPTNRPLRRLNHPDLVYGREAWKYKAIAEHVMEVHQTGRPILIGTVSIQRSELISEALKRRGVKHDVLNAKHHAREAEIVAKAGQLGQVTVATNMAGRGTDIKLGVFPREELIEYWQAGGLLPKKGIDPSMSDEQIMDAALPLWVRHYLPHLKEPFESKPPAEWRKLIDEAWSEWGMETPRLCTHVRDLGGLYIVGTERHEARRIDNQLRGRCARQGDPGASRFFLSLEDDLVRMFASETMANFMRRMGLEEDVPIESKMVSGSIERAQRKVEERNFEIRKNLLEYDAVNNEQRLAIYRMRQAWLEGRELRETIVGFCENHIERRVEEALGYNVDEWDLAGLCAFLRDAFGAVAEPTELEAKKGAPDPRKAILDLLVERFQAAYAAKEAMHGEETMRLLEKMLLLETVDRKWMDHLYAMDLLKGAIHFRGYEGRDPKIVYKAEGFQMFRELMDSLQAEIAELIMKIHPAEEMELEQAVEIEATVHDDWDAYAAEAEERGAEAGAGEIKRQPIVNVRDKVKPNDLCPCGSGRKFKKCCGKRS